MMHRVKVPWLVRDPTYDTINPSPDMCPDMKAAQSAALDSAEVSSLPDKYAALLSEVFSQAAVNVSSLSSWSHMHVRTMHCAVSALSQRVVAVERASE